MSPENDDDDDDGCWDVTDGIINNADCTHIICEKTAWFWKESEFESDGCWGDAVDCGCGEMFWGVSGASWRGFGLKEGNCDICWSDCTCLTGCGSCNALRLNCCKGWCAETDCVCVIEMWGWSDEDCKELWLESMKMCTADLWFFKAL